jgi:hypothetical protein
LPPGQPPREYVGLICVESPEVRFEDVLTIGLQSDGTGVGKIDPTFIEVCEEGSIKVISLAPSLPVTVGATIENGSVKLVTDKAVTGSCYVNVKISGIRKGRNGIRFPRFSADEYNKNRTFWEGWNRR